MSNQPNIVWITLDSVRMDHTTMAGYERDTTPRIAAMAEEGFSHDKCISPGRATPYASASFLTGTYPFRHGLPWANEYLPNELETVPELLNEVGYQTVGLSRNSFVGPGTGLDRGFDRFEWVDSSRFIDAVPLTTLFGWALNIRRHSAGFTTNAGKHSTPYLMNGIAKRWIEDLLNEQPFFFYLHYNEPHHPYYPPLPFLDQYTEDITFTTEEATSFAMKMHREYRSWIANERQLTEDEIDALKALYDAEIRYTDKMVGRLFDYVNSANLNDTVFVVTADHGDYFGEKGLLSHVLAIDDGVTHTPLVVHGMDNLQTNSPVVQQIDLMQSLVEKAGGDTTQFQGFDIRSEKRKYAFTNRAAINESPWKEHNPEFDAGKYHKGKLTSIHTDTFRYQKSEGRAELYDLPDEETDVSDEHPDVAAKLDGALEDWLNTEDDLILGESQSRLDNDMRQQLRDLGYLE